MNKVKQKQKILEWFKNNGKLTTFEAVTEYELHEGGEQYAE